MYRGNQYIKYTPKRYYNIFGSNRLFYVVSGARFATEVAKCVAKKLTCDLSHPPAPQNTKHNSTTMMSPPLPPNYEAARPRKWL